jgi:SNF2 family DNA or RNA helicase
MAVLDEAQQIKNPESQTARAACQIGADFKLALSGTPMENRPDDLWSLFQFLNPALVGSLDRFRELAAKPEALRKRLRPFILRRTKQEAAPELPEKTEQTLFHELSAL